MQIDLSKKEFRRLLDMVYIGNWILNSTRGDDRFADYDDLESKLFALCRGNGMDALREELIALAEPGGHFFSEDTLTDQPERVIASEIVREKLLRFTDKEIPHGVAVVTESMRDLGNLTEIDATIYCERATHKGIIIGKGGAMLKKIGSKAREDMERFFGCKINLRLWVKVKEDWRQRPQILTKLGFNEHDFDQYQ